MSAVTNNRAGSRYELDVDGQKAIAVYERQGGTIVFTHTEVPPELEGHGIATRLIAGALDDVRREDLKAQPDCPFVAAYMQDHPETRDLLANGA